MDLSPICSSKFRPGPPSELTQTISHHLAQVVASSRSLSSSSTVDGGTGGIVDLQQLCIVQGSACWVLYADILCLNYDGNVFDAALIALIAALQNGKR